LAISRIAIDDWSELLSLSVSVVSDEFSSTVVKKYLNDRLVLRDLADWVPFSDTWFDKNFKVWDENAKHILSTDSLQSRDMIECAKVIHKLEKADSSSALCIALENYSQQKAPSYSAIPLASSVTSAVGLVVHSLMIVCKYHLRKKSFLYREEVDELIELLVRSMAFHASNPSKPEYMPYLSLVSRICDQKNLTISVQKLQTLLNSITQLTVDSASVAKERRKMRDLIETLITRQSK
jgi:hypothetical protein